MEKRFKGTQKPQEVIPYLKTQVGSINDEGISGNFSSQVFTPIEQEAHAELWHDAITTIQKCDLMPSELLAQRDELLDVVKFAIHIKTLIINKDCYLKDVVTLTESEIEELKAIEMFEKMLIKAQELINKIK